MIPFGFRDSDWKIAGPPIAAVFAAIAAGLLIFKKLEMSALALMPRMPIQRRGSSAHDLGAAKTDALLGAVHARFNFDRLGSP